MRTAATIARTSKAGTAHPPLPRQPSMADWLGRPRARSLTERLAHLMGILGNG